MFEFINSVSDRIRIIFRERRGNVLALFGLSLIPITFASGMTIDYSRAATAQTRLNSVTDAAALAGVTPAMIQRTRADSAVAAVNMWYAQAGATQCAAATVNRIIYSPCYGPGFGSSDNGTVWAGNDGTISITVTDSNTSGFTRTISMSYNAESSNIFGNLLGSLTIPIGGTSQAKSSNAPYIDIHLVLDTSQSMGLAASDADALALWNKTKQVNGPNTGCTFGCHSYAGSEGGYNAAKVSNESIAGSNGIRLRINSLRDSAVRMIQSAMDEQGSNTYYRFGLYRVGQSHSTISALSTDLTTAKSTAQSISLGPNSAAGIGDTNLPETMSTMLSTISTRGNGITQSSARAFMFLVTDGVTDVQGSCTFGHCTKPIDAATCQAYKDAGITVGIVYTTYLPVKADPTNASSTALRGEYTELIQKMSWPGYSSPNPTDNSRDIKPALQACASSGWFFEASDGAGIDLAMDNLFSQAKKTTRLIN